MTEWELSPEEMLTVGKAYEASDQRESWDRWLAHAAASKAREDTLKEILAMADLRDNAYPKDKDWWYYVLPYNQVQSLIAALKEGKP